MDRHDNAPLLEGIVEKTGTDPLIGRVIAERYELTSRLGEGGMGIVYLANHKRLSRQVVVKTVHSMSRQDWKATARFEREAVGLSQLDHPNIVTIHDFGAEDDFSYLVMEFVDGETLLDRLQAQGFMTLEQFAPVAAQILDAVGEAHSKGIIHRDIKPSNIMLCRKGERRNVVKVLDFGLAKLMDSEDTTLTNQNNLVGTTAFMAPECMVDRDAVDQRVDVYALGVLFYIMLCGKRPIVGENNMTTLYKHVYEDPTPLGEQLPESQDELPEELIAFVHQCLAKKPDERPNTAHDMLVRLNQILGPELILGREASNPSRLSPSWVTRDPSNDALADTLDEPRLKDPGESSSEFILPGTDTGLIETDPASSPRLPDPSARTMSSVNAAPELTSQPSDPSLLNPRIIALGVLILIASTALTALLVTSMKGNGGDASEAGAEATARVGEEKAEPVAEKDAPPEPDPTQNVAKTLDRVAEFVAAKEIARAETLLNAIEDDAKSDPALLERASSLRVQLKLARKLAKAVQHERDHDIDQALSAYRAVLVDDPDQPEAKKQVERLESFGEIQVTSKPAATVKVGGEVLGLTPLTVKYPAGTYTFTLTAPDFREVTREVSLEKQEKAVVNVALKRDRSGRRTTPKPRDETSRNDPANNDTKTDDAPKETTRRVPTLNVNPGSERRVAPLVPNTEK